MPQTIPTVSVADSVAFNLCHIVPYYLRGIFTRNKFWISFWNKVHPDPLAVNFVRRLRRNTRARISISICFERSRWWCSISTASDTCSITRRCHYAADPDLKRTGMSHFQPNALTISRGDEWKDRRRFNEAVLVSAQRVHPIADQFLRAIDQATETLDRQCRPIPGMGSFRSFV